MTLAACAGAGAQGGAVEAPVIAVDPIDAGGAVPMAAPPAEIVAARAAIATLSPGDRFVGHYYCAQGKTALTLTVTDVDSDDGVEMVFAFDFGGGDGYAPARGSYSMTGTFTPATKKLVMKQAEWIEQPPGYIMVDLAGELRGEVLQGNMLAPSCSSFSVVRAPRDTLSR